MRGYPPILRKQLASYEAQVGYYTRHIQSKDEWEFVKVYTDEGISATSTKKCDGFNDMVNDVLAGKIDHNISEKDLLKKLLMPSLNGVSMYHI